MEVKYFKVVCLTKAGGAMIHGPESSADKIRNITFRSFFLSQYFIPLRIASCRLLSVRPSVLVDVSIHSTILCGVCSKKMGSRSLTDLLFMHSIRNRLFFFPLETKLMALFNFSSLEGCIRTRGVCWLFWPCLSISKGKDVWIFNLCPICGLFFSCFPTIRWF